MSDSPGVRAAIPPPTTAGHGRVGLILLCAAQVMLIVDVVVVNVALPAIRGDLGIPDGRIQLVSVSYTLTFGSLLIVFGRAGDLVGRRRLFLVGLASFTLASLLTGLAQNEWQLIAARAGQGVGAAMVAPTALALLTTTFGEGASRNRALGYWAAVGSAGAIGGQLVGGLVTDVLGWRWVFLINVPVGVVTAVAARRFLPETRVAAAGRVGLWGAALLVAGLAAAILALTRFADGGGWLQGLALAAVAALALLAFAAAERRHPRPVIDPRVIRLGHVARANALLAVDAGMLAGTLLFTTLYLQVVLGYTPLQVGAAFAPITLLILLISPRAGAIATRFGTRRPLVLGFALLAAGMLLLARVPTGGSYLRDVLPPLVLMAVGSGLSYAPIFVAGTSGVADGDQGLASGLLNSAQELGTAVGVAVLGAIAAAATVGDGARALTTGYRAALVVAATVMVLSLPLIRRLPGAPKPGRAGAGAGAAAPKDRGY